MSYEKHSPNAEIPTSSIADIAFLLIIFFMITVTFAAQKGLDFRTDVEEPDTVVLEDSILVEILDDSTLRVDGKPMSTQGMLDYLAPKLRHAPKKPVLIRPAGTAPYGAMVDVFDTLRQAKDLLGLDEDVQIALPTEREIGLYWS